MSLITIAIAENDFILFVQAVKAYPNAINAVDPTTGLTPLQQAAKLGRFPMVAHLLICGAVPNAPSPTMAAPFKLTQSLAIKQLLYFSPGFDKTSVVAVMTAVEHRSATTAVVAVAATATTAVVAGDSKSDVSVSGIIITPTDSKEELPSSIFKPDLKYFHILLWNALVENQMQFALQMVNSLGELDQRSGINGLATQILNTLTGAYLYAAQKSQGNNKTFSYAVVSKLTELGHRIKDDGFAIAALDVMIPMAKLPPQLNTPKEPQLADLVAAVQRFEYLSMQRYCTHEIRAQFQKQLMPEHLPWQLLWQADPLDHINSLIKQKKWGDIAAFESAGYTMQEHISRLRELRPVERDVLKLFLMQHSSPYKTQVDMWFANLDKELGIDKQQALMPVNMPKRYLKLLEGDVKGQKGPSSFARLPVDILKEITKYLTPRDIYASHPQGRIPPEGQLTAVRGLIFQSTEFAYLARCKKFAYAPSTVDRFTGYDHEIAQYNGLMQSLEPLQFQSYRDWVCTPSGCCGDASCCCPACGGVGAATPYAAIGVGLYFCCGPSVGIPVGLALTGFTGCAPPWFCWEKAKNEGRLPTPSLMSLPDQLRAQVVKLLPATMQDQSAVSIRNAFIYLSSHHSQLVASNAVLKTAKAQAKQLRDWKAVAAVSAADTKDEVQPTDSNGTAWAAQAIGATTVVVASAQASSVAMTIFGVGASSSGVDLKFGMDTGSAAASDTAPAVAIPPAEARPLSPPTMNRNDEGDETRRPLLR